MIRCVVVDKGYSEKMRFFQVTILAAMAGVLLSGCASMSAGIRTRCAKQRRTIPAHHRGHGGCVTSRVTTQRYSEVLRGT